MCLVSRAMVARWSTGINSGISIPSPALVNLACALVNLLLAVGVHNSLA